MDQLKAEHINGLSVTVPFKQRMCQYVDTLDDYARIASAVSNVVVDEQNRWHGINLDGLGLVQDIQSNYGIPLQNQQILILGAGGATAGILAPLFETHPAGISIANRTLNKAKTLAEDFKSFGPIKVMALDHITGCYDVVINATSMSISQTMPDLNRNHFTDNGFGYDLMYAPDGTVFTHWCDQQGIANSDGKGMLVELSKAAFYRWRGIKVDHINPFEDQ